jgi:hypothetical protein
MSYAHNQRRKFIRKLKRHLKEIHGFAWQEKFKFIMANLKPDLTECSAMEIKKHFIAIRMIEGK